MSVLIRIRQYIRKRLFTPKTEILPEAAYNLWAATYDNQPDNLILSMDTALFADMLTAVTVKDRIVVDVGCGTGRHWNKLLQMLPTGLTGYDISEEMLSILKQKFPGQHTFRLTGNQLNLPPCSCDIVISTLAMAHIENMQEALQEWHRILKPGGEMIITDYHPGALQKGGNRTFTHQGRLVAVKNYIHPIDTIINKAKQLGMDILRFTEKKIDDSVKSWYEKQNALAIFERFKGTPVIYGIHLKKKNVFT